MAEVKVTEDIIRAINISREKLIELIRTGQKKGTITDKTILLDETEVPENFRPFNPNAPPKPETESGKIKAQAELIKAETERIKAEIDLAVAKGERDKPDVINKKLADVTAKEADLLAKLQTVTAKEFELQQREAILAPKEKNVTERLKMLENECNSRINEAEKLAHDKLQQADEEILTMQKQQDELTQEIEQKQSILDGLNALISEYPEKVAPYVEDLNRYIKATGSYALSSHTASRNTNGQQAVYYRNRAQGLWNLEEAFKKLKNTLVGN